MHAGRWEGECDILFLTPDTAKWRMQPHFLFWDMTNSELYQSCGIIFFLLTSGKVIDFSFKDGSFSTSFSYFFHWPNGKLCGIGHFWPQFFSKFKNATRISVFGNVESRLISMSWVSHFVSQQWGSWIFIRSDFIKNCYLWVNGIWPIFPSNL